MILVGPDHGEAAAVARALASELGWPCAAAGDPDALHEEVARVLGRREHLVIVSDALTPDERRIVRGELRGVRFVDLAERSGDPGVIVRDIRREFGL